jgi:hypothetical protein
MKQCKLLSNVDVACNARIIVLWNPNIVNVDLISISDQGLYVVITCLVNHYSFTAIFICGFNTAITRRDLWDDLRKWSPASPWMIFGDFNSILSQEDKHNGDSVFSYEVFDFRKCCADLRLADLNYSRCHFTWLNGIVWSKIDRVMVNSIWSNLSLQAHVHFSNLGAFSNHFMASIQIGPQHFHNASFKFFNMWVDHLGFLELLYNN